jgi:Flp pilus assembly protein TadG
MLRPARVRTRIEGSALLEFAIVLPLLVVFIVGIYDFSGAFNQKQKISHAAQEGAVAAGAQPMTDLDSTNSDPDSLHSVVTVIANSLINDHVVPQAGCDPLAGAWVSGLKWRYTITCGADALIINIDRGVIVDPGPPASVGTTVEVSYPYRWRFNSVIQLLIPGAVYVTTPVLDESATVHNQM